MRAALIRHGALTRAIAAVAMLALTLQVLVPSGYRIAPAKDGRFLTVTFCSDHGTAAWVIDLSKGRILDPDDAPADEPGEGGPPCLCTAGATLALPAQPGTLPAFFAAAEASRRISVALMPGRGLAAPPPWPTGPPLML